MTDELNRIAILESQLLDEYRRNGELREQLAQAHACIAQVRRVCAEDASLRAEDNASYYREGQVDGCRFVGLQVLSILNAHAATPATGDVPWSFDCGTVATTEDKRATQVYSTAIDAGESFALADIRQPDPIDCGEAFVLSDDPRFCRAPAPLPSVVHGQTCQLPAWHLGEHECTGTSGGQKWENLVAKMLPDLTPAAAAFERIEGPPIQLDVKAFAKTQYVKMRRKP